jgi:MFS family permease
VPSADAAAGAAPTVTLGLRANWRQFALLIMVNAFVGGMVGIERAVVPLLAEEDFGQVSATVTLSFIVAFGVVKAISNLLAGRFSDQIGRRRVFVAGWLVALSVPYLVILAPSWEWVVVANVLLGINQGLCWSMTVIMKIDLVGPFRRGLAMGLNEAAGYLAATYSLRPAPFILGIGFSLAGLLLSFFLVRDTRDHARHEARLLADGTGSYPAPSFPTILRTTSFGDRSLFAISQAGMTNNLNDGLAWGLFPLYFAARGASLKDIGWLAAIYPAVWGLGQLVTGGVSDRTGRKPLIVAGMWVQGAGILVILLGGSYRWWVAGTVLLGLGTALVYPVLLAAIGDVVHPAWRASAVGVYRLWRDGGYAIGALLAGILADLFDERWAIGAVAGLTFASGVVVATVMTETLAAQDCSPVSDSR